ncbi:hypothetical protein B484DRAFT_439991 [Ochromonadaceae sp. CCMP2298]|nr:hypothetical protein B484DRAFT_439991 [Ochromonadaceae sp. CCMP2298]
MSRSVSLPQAEPEGSPMRTVPPHSQSGIPDPYSSVLQEALAALHPTRSQAVFLWNRGVLDSVASTASNSQSYILQVSAWMARIAKRAQDYPKLRGLDPSITWLRGSAGEGGRPSHAQGYYVNIGGGGGGPIVGNTRLNELRGTTTLFCGDDDEGLALAVLWTTLPVDARRSIWNLTECGGLHGVPTKLLGRARLWEIKRACGVEGFEGIMPDLVLKGISAPNCGPARFNREGTWLVRWTPGFRHDSGQGMGQRSIHPTEPGRRCPNSCVTLSTREECLILRDCTDEQRAQLLPFSYAEYLPIKSEFLSLCRDRPDQEHTLSKPSLQERRRLVDKRLAADKKAAQLRKAGARSSGLTAWLTGGTMSLPKSGATISEEPRRNIKGEISRIPENPIQGEDYHLTSISMSE